MMKVLLLVLACAMLVMSQTKVDLLIIDDFAAGPQTIITTIPDAAAFPLKQSNIVAPSGTNNILGGERDLELVVDAGSKNLILSTQVSTQDKEFRISTPNGASGFSHIQWDGKDNSLTLAPAGLGAIDFTFTGSANQFKTIVDSDHATVYTVTLTSPGKTCSAEVNVDEDAGEQTHLINFSSFTGGCDFTKIGSVDLQVEAFVAVDASVKIFSVIGTQPSPSPAPPSASALASVSRSNSPPPSPSAGASQSAKPSTQCLCHCPAFTCELIFDPDDDENNAFYFDDDDGINNNGNNGVTSLANGSDASTISISLITVFAAIFVNMF